MISRLTTSQNQCRCRGSDELTKQASARVMQGTFGVETYFLSLFTIASLYGVLTAIMIATA